jgi:hypothetical protein
MDEPEEPVSELPEKREDAAEHFTELFKQARQLQRERGFSTKSDEDEGERPEG